LKINNLNDLLNAVYATGKRFGGQHLWWRGQASAEWGLTPKLYHQGFAYNEHNMTLLFLNRAKIRHTKCPDPHDRASWLFLMQHYGVPTRLLNWSESILVAAYFAVADKKHADQPATLWGLEPTRLNESQIERKGLLVHQDEEALPLFEDAFSSDHGSENDILSRDRIVAILTGQLDITQVVQFSTFTIHGSATPINGLDDVHKYLVEYEIPPEAKPQLLQALNLLGIRRSFLFPDLEHLANDIQMVEFDTVC